MDAQSVDAISIGTARAAGPRAPRALLWALGICLLASSAVWAAARYELATSRPRLLVLGDSVLDNVQFLPGSRLEKILQRKLGTRWSVQSFAESGSRMGDYYPLLAKAELLGFTPHTVIIQLNPAKLQAEWDVGPGLNDDGRELMWVPLNEEGAGYFKTLSPRYKDALVPRKVSLLFGFYEAVRVAWRHNVTCPARRRAALAEPPAARAARIRARSISMGTAWSKNVELLSYEQFRASAELGKLDFLLDALKRRKVRPILLLSPGPNPGLAAVAFSDRGRAALTLLHQHVERYASERHVALLALDEPGFLQKLEASDWDDMEHVRSTRAVALIADAVADALTAPEAP